MRMPSFIKYGAAHGIFAVITFVRKRSNFRAGSFLSDIEQFKTWAAVRRKRKESDHDLDQENEVEMGRNDVEDKGKNLFGTNCKGGQICHTFHCRSRKFFDMPVDATLGILKVSLL